jgi:ribosomal-protein-alanine N-acetyltransferase
MYCHAQVMTASDIDTIADIERACFPVPWGRNAFLSELNNPYALNIVIKVIDPLENGRIYAYSSNHIVEEELSILKMAVAPEKRRLGIGEFLMETVLYQASRRGAAQAFLEVRPSNRNAISLYKKMGFRVIGTRPNYYPETGETALVMMKRLKETS